MISNRQRRTVAVLGSALALSGIGGGLALAAGGHTSSPTSVRPATDPATPGDRPDTRADVPTRGDRPDAKADVPTKGDRPDARADRETADRPGQEGVENPSAEARDDSESHPANERGAKPDHGHEDAGHDVVHAHEDAE